MSSSLNVSSGDKFRLKALVYINCGFCVQYYSCEKSCYKKYRKIIKTSCIYHLDMIVYKTVTQDE